MESDSRACWRRAQSVALGKRLWSIAIVAEMSRPGSPFWAGPTHLIPMPFSNALQQWLSGNPDAFKDLALQAA